MDKAIKFAIHTLGCKVNQYESEKMIAQLKKLGWELVPFPSAEANAHIINTCTVTAVANHKSRQLIRRAVSASPNGIIAVTGCYAESDKADIEAIDGVDLVIGNSEKAILAGLISDRLGLDEGDRGSMPPTVMENNSDRSRTRALIKVQDGCVNFCTYCIVPYVRGELQYKPIEDVVEEVSASVAAGVREIVLTGIHLGLYGRQSKSISARKAAQSAQSIQPAQVLKIEQPTQFTQAMLYKSGQDGSKEIESALPAGQNPLEIPKEKTSLSALIKRLIEIPDIGRIRLSSIELNEVTPELVEIMATSGKLCNHLHIPLQSGSDSILKRMNRHYTTADFIERITRLRREIKDLAITTDVIVGFPGESESDFMQTVETIKAAAFSKLHVFKYSQRKGTPAAGFDGQIPSKVKDERSAVLIELGKRLSESYVSQYLGKELEVLIERDLGDYLSGISGNYIRVHCTGPSENIGRIVKVSIDNQDGEKLTGTVCK